MARHQTTFLTAAGAGATRFLPPLGACSQQTSVLQEQLSKVSLRRTATNLVLQLRLVMVRHGTNYCCRPRCLLAWSSIHAEQPAYRGLIADGLLRPEPLTMLAARPAVCAGAKEGQTQAHDGLKKAWAPLRQW
jgi:hypothetical protein